MLGLWEVRSLAAGMTARIAQLRHSGLHANAFVTVSVRCLCITRKPRLPQARVCPDQIFMVDAGFLCQQALESKPAPTLQTATNCWSCAKSRWVWQGVVWGVVAEGVSGHFGS